MRIKEMKGGRELMKRQLNIHSHSASHFHSRAVSVSRVVSVSQAISLYSPKMKNMKSIFTTAFVMLITTFLCAQAPQGIPYQAVMRNAGGSVMASSAVSLTFMIHDGAATGAVRRSRRPRAAQDRLPGRRCLPPARLGKTQNSWFPAGKGEP